MSEMKSDNKYDFSLKQYSNHKSVFPWWFILKIIMGCAMIGLFYYLTKTVIEKQSIKFPVEESALEIPID